MYLPQGWGRYIGVNEQADFNDLASGQRTVFEPSDTLIQAAWPIAVKSPEQDFLEVICFDRAIP